MTTETDTSISLGTAENYARQRAQTDAPDDFCSLCVEETPLAYSNARDIYTIDYLQEVMGDVADEVVEEIGAEWVEREIHDAYIDAYWEFCADPSECEVCTHPDEYGSCGHEDVGEECPARTEER